MPALSALPLAPTAAQSSSASASIKRILSTLLLLSLCFIQTKCESPETEIKAWDQYHQRNELGSEESNLRGHRRDEAISQEGTVYTFGEDTSTQGEQATNQGEQATTQETGAGGAALLSRNGFPSAAPSECFFTASEFQTEVLLTMNGELDSVTDQDMELVQNVFVQAYNNIAGGLCDAQFRFVVEVGNGTLVRLVLPKQEQPTNTTRRLDDRPLTNTGFEKFSFRFFVLGICRGCPSKSRIFNDGIRRLQSGFNFDTNDFTSQGGMTGHHIGSYMTNRVTDMATMRFSYTVPATRGPSGTPSMVPTGIPSAAPSWDPLTFSCSCLSDTGLENRAADSNEFQTAYNQTIATLNANGSLTHIGEIVGVQEVETKNCTNETGFTSEVIIAVSGDPDLIELNETLDFAMLVLAVYGQTQQGYCDPYFRNVEDVKEIYVEGKSSPNESGSRRLFDSFNTNNFFGSLSSFASASKSTDTNTPAPTPSPISPNVQYQKVSNERYRPFQFRLVVRGTCRGCPSKSRIFDDGFRRNLREEQIQSSDDFLRMLQSAQEPGVPTGDDLCICPTNAEPGIPGEKTFRFALEAALTKSKLDDADRFPHIGTAVFEAIQVDDTEPSSAPSEAPSAPSGAPSKVASNFPSGMPSHSFEPSSLPSVSPVPTDSPVPSPSPSMTPTRTVPPT